MEERARRIVETAVELAEEGGFEAVRLRDVASRAGVALGTLYRHFRSKEDLLMAALSLEAEALVRQMKHHPAKGATPEERLTAYFTAATRTLCRKPKLARAVLRAGASGEPELTEKLRRFHDACAEMAIAALRGKPLGVEKPTPLEMTISSILHQVWFAALLAWMGGLHTQSEVVREVRAAAEFVIRGPNGSWWDDVQPRS